MVKKITSGRKVKSKTWMSFNTNLPINKVLANTNNDTYIFHLKAVPIGEGRIFD